MVATPFGADLMGQRFSRRFVPDCASHEVLRFGMTIDAEQFALANRRRLSAPGIRTFVAIADLWEIEEEEAR